MGDYNDAFLRNNAAGGAANVQSRVKAQARTNVLQLKLIGQSHPTGLTNNLLKLFEPRPPLEFKPPPEKNKCPPYSGMAQYVPNFAEPSDAEYAPPVQKGETPTEKRARVHQLRLEEGAKRAAEELEKYDPSNDPNISGDPYKTLFVARLNYETTESRIKREFEAYGPIKRVRLVADKEKNKPRGYAFIEYMHTRDMKAAYKQADGRKLDNRRVLVDVERGRTVPNWRPRRLGGGLGTTRVGGEEVNQRHSGREQNQSGGSRQSEEPKVREERDSFRDREKSRDRGKDREREREKSRDRSHERPRERDHRDDRHHRDRDRTRDRERERDKGRDRTRDRDRKERSGRDRHRDEERSRGRDHEVDDIGRDRGRSRDKDYDYERLDAKHERDRHGDRDKSYGQPEPEDEAGWYKPEQEHIRSEAENEIPYDYYEDRNGLGKYNNPSNEDIHDRYQHSERDHDRYDQMDEDREYHRSDRSLSRDYK
ncbi:U1 small nuclear ribonucleoprotein 70 kDa [Heracleum sosnowskyi]|uniref:U1 small nuclear ribonucleoprotein 70 kDa n=1 Tax=Heracleum sosnowskyi TaxID=360622 RepID=A0AAD8H9F3_9APIA|nr:U1 small nuclear ribonucleoprotein 70 kDa [Heracleum sosnowskyi]